MLSKRRCRTVTDDEMVQYPDIHQSQRLLQTARQLSIGTTGLSYSGWMIMSENDGSRILR